MSKERRFYQGLELRARDGDSKLPTIRGYTIKFNELSDPYWSRAVGFFEKIAPEAPVNALADPNRDIRALFNHDPNFVLGRAKPSAGTASVRHMIDDVGVLVEIDPPNTQQARDIVENIRAGNIDGMSFGFYVDDATWDEEHDGIPVRTIRSMRMIDDVTIATYPVFNGTTAEVRSVIKDTCGAIPEPPEQTPQNRSKWAIKRAEAEIKTRLTRSKLRGLN